MAILPRPVPTTATKPQMLAEIANLDGIITTITSQLGVANAQVATLTTTNSNLVRDNGTLKTDLATANAALAPLQAAIVEQEAEIATLEAEVDSFAPKSEFLDALQETLNLADLAGILLPVLE